MVLGNKVEPLTLTVPAMDTSISISTTSSKAEFVNVNSQFSLTHDASTSSKPNLPLRRPSRFASYKPPVPTELDPALQRLLTFFGCFGLFLNIEFDKDKRSTSDNTGQNRFKSWSSLIKVFITCAMSITSGDIVYAINLRQSKLVAEQKRSTPLLTFCIVAYTWLSLIVPYICIFSLMTNGSRLFRFYNKTTAKVFNGLYQTIC